MRKRKVLWISPHLPYDSVAHAGGKTHNYYVNRMCDDERFEVKLLSFYWENELEKFTLNRKIDCILIEYKNRGFGKIYRNIKDLEYLHNPFNRYGNITTKFLKDNIYFNLIQLKHKGYVPDAIVLEWTQVVLFAQIIKKIFPKSKIVAIEVDVSFLNYKRKINLSKNQISRRIARIRYRNLKKEEIKALSYCNIVICQNYKDKKLLQNNRFNGDIRVIIPYYNKMFDVKRTLESKKNLLFFGDMSRPENYLSVEWFIREVMPLLRESDMDVSLQIIGGRPDARLYHYENENIHILGYVENVSTFFSKGLCMVAPLLYGAGIKVKVIEAMSAGLPVLTNDIGVEGIPAQNGYHYLYCSKPKDYVDSIKKLYNDMLYSKQMGDNSQKLVKKYFDYDKSAESFLGWLI